VSCGSLESVAGISFEINVTALFENTGTGQCVAVSVSTLVGSVAMHLVATGTDASVTTRVMSGGDLTSFMVTATGACIMMVSLSSPGVGSARSFRLPRGIRLSRALEGGIALVLMSDLCAALDLVKAEKVDVL
jgi:hypothetical protein